MTFLIFSILTDVSFSLVFANVSVFIIPFSWRYRGNGKIDSQMVLYAPLPNPWLTAPTAPSEENNNRGVFGCESNPISRNT